MMRDDGLAKSDALIIVLGVDHLPPDGVLDGLLQLVLVQLLQGVHLLFVVSRYIIVY